LSAGFFLFAGFFLTQLFLAYLFLFLLNESLGVDELTDKVYLRWAYKGTQATLYAEVYASLLDFFN
jgi:hypothetical protein